MRLRIIEESFLIIFHLISKILNSFPHLQATSADICSHQVRTLTFEVIIA